MNYLVRYEAEIKGAKKDDFFTGTKANFVSCAMPEGTPDYVSKSGSVYYYTDEGVVRVADHWIGCATCYWTLDGVTENDINLAVDKKEFAVAGFCKWNDFSRVGTIEEIKDMPKGTRKNSYVCINGKGYKVLAKAA